MVSSSDDCVATASVIGSQGAIFNMTLFLPKWKINLKIPIQVAARTNIPGVKNGENTFKVGRGDGALVA